MNQDHTTEYDPYELGGAEWLALSVRSAWLSMNFGRSSDDSFDAEQREEDVPNIAGLNDRDLILLSIAARLDDLFLLLHKQAWMVQDMLKRSSGQDATA